MSEDILTSDSSWPELTDLGEFWDADETPPRGLPRVGGERVDDVDDDPTPVNAPRPIFNPTLPPPTTLPVAGPAPFAVAEPPGLPTGAPLAGPPTSATVTVPKRPWLRRVAVITLAGGLVVAGAFGWQWNEARHDAASAAQILPSAPVAAAEVNLVEFEIDRTVEVSVRTDLDSGESLAVVSGGLSIARTDDAFWTREAGADTWTPATPTFLRRNAAIIELIENAEVVTVTDLFPAAVHPYLGVVDDRSAQIPDIAPRGSTVIDVSEDGNLRRLTLRVDRDAFGAAEPLLAQRLRLAGDGLVDVEVWVDRAGVVWRLSAPPDVTAIGGEYRLVTATTAGSGPLDDLDPGAFDTSPPTTASPETASPETASPPTDAAPDPVPTAPSTTTPNGG